MPLGGQPTSTVSAARLRRLIEGLRRKGVTRLADQTGLDRLGVPCMAAIRPNAGTVTTHQGKGETLEAAAFSALMEAAEYIYAEQPAAPDLSASIGSLAEQRVKYLGPNKLLPAGNALPPDISISWLTGTDLVTGDPVLVPCDMVALMEARDMPDLSQNTNGLAAGFDATSARLHGLCELIERDAMVLWGFRSDAAAAQSEIDPTWFGDENLNSIGSRLAAEDVSLRLFDMTTDIGIPVIYAVMTDRRSDLAFAISTGAACHPVALTAARRAVLEAAQTRISLIAGVRDDIAEGQYERAKARSMLPPPSATSRPAPTGLPDGEDVDALLRHILNSLMEVGLREIVTVPVGGGDIGIFVEKLFVPGLEDRLTNRHWRPGHRAVRAMLSQ